MPETTAKTKNISLETKLSVVVNLSVTLTTSPRLTSVSSGRSAKAALPPAL